jgi:ketosteroid isomerase-like protein
MISKEKAQELVQDWIEIWNSHNIDDILSPYRDDVVLTSPFVVKLLGDNFQYSKTPFIACVRSVSK